MGPDSVASNVNSFAWGGAHSHGDGSFNIGAPSLFWLGDTNLQSYLDGKLDTNATLLTVVQGGSNQTITAGGTLNIAASSGGTNITTGMWTNLFEATVTTSSVASVSVPWPTGYEYYDVEIGSMVNATSANPDLRIQVNSTATNHLGGGVRNATAFTPTHLNWAGMSAYSNSAAVTMNYIEVVARSNKFMAARIWSPGLNGTTHNGYHGAFEWRGDVSQNVTNWLLSSGSGNLSSGVTVRVRGRLLE
jgi:hypothetical protein